MKYRLAALAFILIGCSSHSPGLNQPTFLKVNRGVGCIAVAVGLNSAIWPVKGGPAQVVVDSLP
jgi:hypothetical protein